MTAPLALAPALKLDATKLHGVEWAPYVLQAARKAARETGMTLAWWDEVASTARACLTADALPVERECFLRVIRERFEVTEYFPRSNRNE